MEKEFDLSSKIGFVGEPPNSIIGTPDVKEFIRRLKELGNQKYKELGTDKIKDSNWLVIKKEDLDKLAGKDLI